MARRDLRKSRPAARPEVADPAHRDPYESLRFQGKGAEERRKAMATLRRYVVVETLKIFLVTIAVTLLLMVLGGGAKEGLKQGLPPELVAQILPYMVPEMLRFTIPGCLLFAVCSVFGRMTAANEITAIKSLGINPLAVVWPALIMAYGLSIVTFAMYDACAVWSRPNLRRTVEESVDRVAYGFLRTNGSFQSQGISIVVKGVEGEQLCQPVITVEPRGQRPAMTVVAKQARLAMDRDSGVLRIECQQGRLDVAGKGAFRFPDNFVQAVGLREPVRARRIACLPPRFRCAASGGRWRSSAS